jgi:hypothetical protein
VRGGFVFNGNVYAVRDNAGATEGKIHKATAAGWVTQSFGRLLRFRLGLVEIAEGATVTGATSGATAHVERVIVKTGAWGAALDADKAAGNLIVSAQTGTFQVNEVLKVGATSCATNDSGGNSTAIALPPGGRYVFKVKNFYGATNLRRAYGVNGVGTGFEYDGGSVLVPIETGTPTDTPERVFEIANALGFVFPGGSIQLSEPGEPCVFNAILGALEIGFGDDVTDVIDSSDDAVIFFGKSKVATLTGRGVDTFVLSEITEEAGAEAWTAQKVGRIMYLDNRGLRDLTTTAAWGNFRAGAMSQLFDRYLDAKRRAGASRLPRSAARPSRSTGSTTTTAPASPSSWARRTPRCCRSRPTPCGSMRPSRARCRTARRGCSPAAPTASSTASTAARRSTASTSARS